MTRHAPVEDKSTMTENLMMLGALAPVVGAILAAPGMGGTLVTLGLWDSVLLWFFVR